MHRDLFEENLFPQRLREVREAKQIKKTVLSELAGCDRNAVAEYESGRRALVAKTVKNLALVLNTSADYLLGIDERDA